MSGPEVESHGPLAGWRVVELAEGTAACFCGRILAGLGAEVVMIEPPDGHALRSAEPLRADGVSGRFHYLAAGKRSVVVDPSLGNGVLRRLLKDADLVVTDLDSKCLEEVASGSVTQPVVFVRPFGLTGPYATHRAHHLTIFHASGESSTLPSGPGFELFPERAPLPLGSEIGFFDAGWNAGLVALSLLYDPLNREDPLRADVSVHESELTLSRTRINRYLNDGVCVGRERRRYGITGMLACPDGWIQLVGMREEHWDRLLQLDEGAVFRQAGFDTAAARADRTQELGALLARWCSERTKLEAAAVLSGIGAPVGIFANPVDCLASEQLAHRGFFQAVDDGAGGQLTLPTAPYRFSLTPLSSRPAPQKGSSSGFSARPLMSTSVERGQARLLEGVRVLDFTWAAAGPYATLLLGFLGAEVVKVESLRRLDPARRGFLTQYDGVDRSPIFNELNLNKRSLQIDLTQPESLAIITEMVGGFDVVVDNFRPGVMDRLGLGAKTLLADHPHLVVASSSANGSTGPEAMGAGLASIFAASGGLSVQTGYPDGPPTEVSDTMDYRSGTALAVAIVAALLHRARTGLGLGQLIDLSSREVALASAPDGVLAHCLGVDWQLRVGNGHRMMVPHGVYPCVGDGWVAVAVNGEREWAALCEVVQHPEWIARFPTKDARRRAEQELTDSIARWTRDRQAGEVAALLQAHGVAAAPVMSFAAIAEDPHLAARETFVEVKHPELGVQKVMRAPWRFVNREALGLRPAPLLGADNEELLSGSRRASVLVGERREEVFR